MTPPSGPETSQLAIHRHILRQYNESAILLAFHPSDLQSSPVNSGKLPITIYETVFEGENAADAEGAMQVDGEAQGVHIRFRELPYSIVTGDAEMIGVDHVARGAGTATAVEKAAKPAEEKGKKPGEEEKETAVLSPEDEECKCLMISSNVNLLMTSVK